MEPEHLRLLRLFEEEGVEYLIVGGYAVIAHGYPRFTNDLDLLIRTGVGNGARAVRALERFGRPAGEFEDRDFAQKPQFISFATDRAWFDLMTEIPGIDADAAFANRQLLTWGGLTLPFIDLANLRANKRATGRTKDLLDLENLAPD